MSSEGLNDRNKARFTSPAGVEWSANKRTGVSAEEAYNLPAHAEMRASLAAGGELSDQENAELAAMKIKVRDYLVSQGIDTDTADKVLRVRTGRTSPDRIVFTSGMWHPLTERLSVITTRKELRSAHELVHAVSENKVHLQDNVAGAEPLVATRIGLESRIEIQGKLRSFFNQLNEAITNEVALRALGRGDEEVGDWMKLFRTMMTSIGRGEMSRGGELNDADKVRTAFLHSVVYGWDGDLKKAIRNTFGPDALKILALMGPAYVMTTADRDYFNDEFLKIADENRLLALTEDIRTYFSSTNKEHEQLGADILSRLEFLRAYE